MEFSGLNIEQEDIGISDDSGFASIAGSASVPLNTNTEKLVSTISNNVMLTSESSWTSQNSNTTTRKRPNKIISEEEVKAKQQYEKDILDQRYKRLMHLLDRSQFYSSFLVQKIDSSLKKDTKKLGAKRKSKILDENSDPRKKSKVDMKHKQNYDITNYVNVQEMKKKAKHKLNLSEEEIKDELETENAEAPTSSEPDITPAYFHGELRDYQVEGLKWLKILYENGVNGILGDEMGLGKTIQVIALLCHLIEKRIPGPYLIIAPLSTLPNWIIEFERFAPSLPVVVLHGKEEERRKLHHIIQTKCFDVHGQKTQPIVLTTFEVPLQEAPLLRKEQWRYIIIDEGHRIKNPNCQLIQVLKTCQSMSRLLLTGTPLQNNLKELWSLLHFLLPEVFDDLAIFESWFDATELQNADGFKKILDQEADKKVLATLRGILKPFMLRRVKTDVCLDIPPKKEVVVYAPMTELQHKLYAAVLARDIQILSRIDEHSLILPEVNGQRPKRLCRLKSQDANAAENSFSRASALIDEYDEDGTWKQNVSRKSNDLSIWKQFTDIDDRNREFFVPLTMSNKMVMYKKIVNHPYLIHCPLNSGGLPLIDDDLIKSSGKLSVLDAMLVKLKAQGHKVLLFSTWIMILDMIEDYLSMRDWKYCRLDGKMMIDQRKEQIKSFNSDPNVFLFLISTRAGGVGLNLAAADTVIIYDSDWNPQADIQAMARCHRIGQTRPVVVYKLCTKGTIDERIMSCAEAKRKLEKMVISKGIDKINLNSKDTLLALQKLLNSSENHVVTSKQDIYTEKELSDLLDRSDLMLQPKLEPRLREAKVLVKKLL